MQSAPVTPMCDPVWFEDSHITVVFLVVVCCVAVGVGMRRSADEPPADCLECKLVGTGAMLGLSGYFAYLTNQLPANAGVGHRRFNIVMCVGFAAAGVMRFLA